MTHFPPIPQTKKVFSNNYPVNTLHFIVYLHVNFSGPGLFTCDFLGWVKKYKDIEALHNSQTINVG